MPQQCLLKSLRHNSIALVQSVAVTQNVRPLLQHCVPSVTEADGAYEGACKMHREQNWSMRWDAVQNGDEEQRELDNARVLWRRNWEQNRREVVRTCCSAERSCTAWRCAGPALIRRLLTLLSLLATEATA